MKMIKNYYNFHKILSVLCPKLYQYIFYHKKKIKYVISGGLAAIASIGVSFFFTEIFSIWYLMSTILGFFAGVVTSFLLQKFWTFGDQSLKKIKIQFLLYLLVVFMALILNTVLVFFFVEYLNIWYIFSQILASLIIVVFNFFFYRRWVFKS